MKRLSGRSWLDCMRITEIRDTMHLFLIGHKPFFVAKYRNHMRYWYAVGPAMKLLRYDIEFLCFLWKIRLAVKRTPLAFDRTSLDFHTIDCLFLFCKLSFFSYIALALCPFTLLYSLGYLLHPSVFNLLLITFIICRAKQHCDVHITVINGRSWKKQICLKYIKLYTIYALLVWSVMR